MAKSSHTPLMQVALWITLALGIAFFLGSLNLPKYRALVSGGVKTYGTVLAVEPENHQFVKYSYESKGVIYTGSSNAGQGNPTFKAISQGDKVLLYYVAADPASSALGEPRPRLQNEIISVLLGPLILLLSVFVRFLFAKFHDSKQ